MTNKNETFFRPDTTYGIGREPYRRDRKASGNEYPYDRERGKWGEPAAYSRDSSGHGPSHATVPTPKNVDSDDERWKQEALGVPFNSDKAGRGTGGNTGGRVMPGTSGQWSSRPKGGHWDNVVDDEILKIFGELSGDEDEYEAPKIAMGAFKMSPGLSSKHSRHQPGMTWKESKVPKLTEVFKIR